MSCVGGRGVKEGIRVGLKTTLKSEKSHENIRLSSDARKKENQRDVGATRTTWTGSVEPPGGVGWTLGRGLEGSTVLIRKN